MFYNKGNFKDDQFQRGVEQFAVPEIFKDAENYVYTIEALERTQATFNEKGLYHAIVSFAISWFEKTKRPARLLDLCSSTGLSAYHVSQNISVFSVDLVDTDEEALKNGSDALRSICQVTPHCTDAVTFQEGIPYDLILMNSAYHHIDHARKVAFLKNAATLLAGDGAIILGDNFLPPYSNLLEYKQSVVIYYSQLLRELEKRGEPNEVLNVIRKSGYNCWLLRDEYKVSMNQFNQDLFEAELAVCELKQIWKMEAKEKYSNEIISGSYAFYLCSFHHEGGPLRITSNSA